jgi:hypothetical protein
VILEPIGTTDISFLGARISMPGHFHDATDRGALKDLDIESGTKRYLQSRHWHICRPNFKAVARAVEALGGKMEVRWKYQATRSGG